MSTYQIPRNSLIWLMAAMFAGLAPHMVRLPLWVTLVCLLCGGWRIMVYRSRWRLPGRGIKTLLVFSGAAAVVGHYHTLAGPEAGSALLVLGFCFKLLETHTRRDAFVVVILGYFVVATNFFFVQGMAITGYLLGVCFLVTAALVGLNQSILWTHPRRTARQAARLLLHSLPLMLLLFIFVPRVGPVWSLNLGDGQARTGISDRIAPGDIAALSRSPALAFRAEFEGAIPPAETLYWRGLVLSHYDGASWSRAGPDMDSEPLARWPPTPGQAGIERLGRRLRYRVILEPSHQRWLFGLNAASSPDRGVGQTRDQRLISRTLVNQAFGYRVTSDLDYVADRNLPRWLRELNLQLPGRGDPRTRALAGRLAGQGGSPAQYVERVLGWFRGQPFAYTLHPPPLNGDRIDQFLFETRRGFCSHYAGAFVYLMRAAGVPARIVAGYQGGEVNPLGNYLLVHQFDAHAWAEVWLAGRGWVRVDPTAVVAPERVEQGVEQALAGEASFLEDSLLSPVRYRHLAWVSRIRLAVDYLNFAWHRSVVGYNASYQQRFLSGLLGQVDYRKLGLWLAGSIGLALGLLALWLFRRSLGRRKPRLVRSYEGFCRRMRAKGLGPSPGEAPASYLARLAVAWPGKAALLARIGQLYQAGLYGGGDGPALQRQLRRLTRQL